MEEGNWVSVEKRFPVQWKDVLVYDGEENEFFVAYINGKNEWVVHGMEGCEFHITYWMPLPASPGTK